MACHGNQRKNESRPSGRRNLQINIVQHHNPASPIRAATCSLTYNDKAFPGVRIPPRDVTNAHAEGCYLPDHAYTGSPPRVDSWRRVSRGNLTIFTVPPDGGVTNGSAPLWCLH